MLYIVSLRKKKHYVTKDILNDTIYRGLINEIPTGKVKKSHFRNKF